MIGNTNNYEAAQLILQNNKQLLTTTDTDGNQPLCDAISSGNTQMVELYLAHGALLYARNDKGETPAFFAVKNNRANVLETLKGYNIDITVTNNNGEGLVHYGALFDAVDALRVLKKHGASFSQRTVQGDTGIHIAAKNNSVNTLRYFQSIGEDFDYTNNAGHTPFIAAALEGKLASTRFLFSEISFRNNEVDYLLNTLSRARTREQKEVYDFIKDEQNKYLAECRKIRNEYIIIVNMITDNQHALTTMTERNGLFGILNYLVYQPTQPINKSVDDIYKMTKEERIALFNHYIQCKSEELNNKIKIESQRAVLRAEEERVRVAEITIACARVEEQARITEQARVAAERARIQERNHFNNLRCIEEQTKIEQEQQARHTHALEGMHVPTAPLDMQPSAPAFDEEEPLIVIDMQPSAPTFDEEEQGICCIGSNSCTEEQGVVVIPCKNRHSYLICKTCLAQIKNSTNLCPLCRERLL